MKTVLMVAEKPSLAQSLSKILARGGQITSRKGFNGACSIHEFVTRFPLTGETMRFKFTSVCGHVMSLDFLGKYNNWDKVDPVSYFYGKCYSYGPVSRQRLVIRRAIALPYEIN